MLGLLQVAQYSQREDVFLKFNGCLAADSLLDDHLVIFQISLPLLLLGHLFKFQRFYRVLICKLRYILFIKILIALINFRVEFLLALIQDI